MYFNGLCMIPDASWHAKMEIEHWERYYSFLPLFNDAKVLDCASGEGYGSNLIASVAKSVIGLDISHENINHANKKYAANKVNLKFLLADCTKPMDVVDGKFDIITSFETFEHVFDPDAMIFELSSLLSEDGILIFSTPKPNLNQETGKPNNPHHVKEYDIDELLPFLSAKFLHVKIAGQSDLYPFKIHREYLKHHDRFILAIAGNNEDSVNRAFQQLPNYDHVIRIEKLTDQHIKSTWFKPRPPRIIFVPLDSSNPQNPSDRRRIQIIRNHFAAIGIECAVMPKEDAVGIWSDLIISQDRDYQFWNHQKINLTKQNRKLIFSASDLLEYSSVSRAHYFGDEYQTQSKLKASAPISLVAKSFFEETCDFILLGSQAQVKHLAGIFDIEKKIDYFYDPIDLEFYYRKPENIRPAPEDEFRIAWEGYCDNVPYLIQIAPALIELAREIPVKLVVATSKMRRNLYMGTQDNKELVERIFGNKIAIEFHEWSDETIGNLLQTCHIGISPNFIDDEFSSTKPPNKAIIMNHLGLPVIASPTNGNIDYIENGLNGFIVTNTEMWFEKLKLLANNPNKLQSMRQGAIDCAEKFIPSKLANDLFDLIKTSTNFFSKFY